MRAAGCDFLHRVVRKAPEPTPPRIRRGATATQRTQHKAVIWNNWKSAGAENGVWPRFAVVNTLFRCHAKRPSGLNWAEIPEIARGRKASKAARFQWISNEINDLRFR